MKEIFLESHNLKNPYTGFGQFNRNLIQEMIHQNDTFRFILNLPIQQIISQEFPTSKYVGHHLYYDWQRYPLFRIRKKYALWHSLNQNTKVEPYYNIPYILTVHDVTFFRNPQYIKQERYLRFKEKVDRAQALTFISQFVLDSTQEYIDLKDKKTLIIPNGTNVITHSNPNIHTAKFLPTPPYIFTIGEVKSIKNSQSLLALVQDHRSLLIAGKQQPEYAQSIREEAVKLGIEKQVHLIGPISENDKLYYYQNCEAFCFPSLYEGFGLPVLEAMQFSKPIFLSALSSLPEVGGEAAFYWTHFEPQYMRDVYEKGLQTFAQRKAWYLEKYTQNIEKYSWQKAAKSYLNLYQEILQDL